MVPEILAVNEEHVERDEVRPLTPEQQPIEQRAAIGRQTYDLAVEHAGHRTDGVRDLVEQHRVLLVDVPAAGHERAAVALDVRERAEAVVLQLEQPVRMIERTGDAN